MKFLHSIFSIALLMCLSFPACTQNDKAANSEKLAVSGYDVVAYFNANEAVRGSSDNSVNSDGATYYFSSPENAKTFSTNPEAYKPKYGGNCAFGMGMQGAAVPSDPETFKIRDGQLYLFYNDFYKGKPFNTVIPWNADESELIAKADANWKKF